MHLTLLIHKSPHKSTPVTKGSFVISVNLAGFCSLRGKQHHDYKVNWPAKIHDIVAQEYKVRPVIYRILETLRQQCYQVEQW